jgi:PAS domain S-box-containing protein
LVGRILAVGIDLFQGESAMPAKVRPAVPAGPSFPMRTPPIDGFTQALVNALGVGFLAVDASGTTILSNAIARDSFGTVPGRALKAAFPALWPRVQQVLMGHNKSSEFSLRRKKTNYLIKVNPILLNSERIGAICVFVESSGLEEMAMQMSFFQEIIGELEAVINSSSEGLWICDAEANVLRMNPASERIHGIRAEDVIGRNMRELVDEGFIDRSATLEVIKAKSKVSLLQYRKGRKLVTTGTPVFDVEGRLIRVVSSVRDTTEIETMQRELEEQEALKDQFRNHMLELQHMEFESKRVIAKSPCMLKALRQAIKVGSADSSVLLLGESGVGKGLIAEIIHKHSPRSERPLIRINCGSIPDSLIESELFGYEKGAFTGASVGGKPGSLEMADSGTLFLDEIAELPPPSQVKLLRFLEDGRITRLGGTSSRLVDVRILAATHRNLEEMIGQGTFRLDLYYRLKVVPIHVPPVRERKDCILLLIHHYLDFFGKKNGTQKRLTRAASDALLLYPYPGNVRELINICERLVVMSETDLIDLKDLPSDIIPRFQQSLTETAEWTSTMTLQQALDGVERTMLIHSMRTHGNQRRMAAALGVNQSTIARKLEKHGLG